VLAIAGQGIHLVGLLPALLLYLPLAALALGIALICASVQVFVRDLVQALGQLLPLLMFSAPVYYDRLQLPERYRGWLDFNPFTFYAESIRSCLLQYGNFDFRQLAIAVVIAVAVLLAGHALFRRLDPHFEDFL
jgi:lipopolysaccharide transport system permease protein